MGNHLNEAAIHLTSMAVQPNTGFRDIDGVGVQFTIELRTIDAVNISPKIHTQTVQWELER